MPKPEKVVRDGKVAVIVSPGFGAGWSSWTSGDDALMALFDRRFVEAKEAGLGDVSDLAKEVFGDKYFYCGGWSKAEVEWLPEGTQFYIDEYDGSESIVTAERLAFTA